MELSLLREEEKQTFKRQDENSVSCVKEIYNSWKHFLAAIMLDFSNWIYCPKLKLKGEKF